MFAVAAARVTLGVVLSVAAPLAARAAPAQRSSAAAVDPAATPEWAECSTPDDDQPLDAPERARGKAQIVVRDGTIGFDVRDCALTDLLALVAAQTDIRITVSDTLPARRVTLRTNPAPIETAIRELLHDTDFFTLYTARAKGPQRLAAVWVYPRGSTRDIAPVPAELWVSTGELEHQLTDNSSELRARAIEELIARTGEAALPRVLEVLMDPSADVRQRALDAALTAQLEVPLSQLHALALNDVSPEVRLRALQALEALPDSTWIIETAATDADANIRREAQGILRRLNQTPR